MESPLQGILEAEEAAGRYHSSGSFSVDRERRLAKVAMVVAMEPYIFLGRMLQAATVAVAREIHFLVGEKSLRVEIVPDDWEPFRLFFESIQQGRTLAGAVSQYLELAVASALALQPPQLLLHFGDPCKSETFDLIENQMVSASTEHRNARRLSVALEYFWPKGSGWLQKLREAVYGRIEVSTFINLHCCYSIIPAFLDRRRLSYCTATHSSWVRDWVTPYVYAVSARYVQPDPSRSFNAPSPCWRTALATRLVRSGAAETAEFERRSKGIGHVVFPAMASQVYLSLREAQFDVPVELSFRQFASSPNPVPDPARLLSVVANIVPTDENPRVEIKTAIYVDAPQSLVHDSLNEDSCQYACSSFKALCYTGPVLGKRPLSQRLILIKDGLAIQSPPLPSFWKNGWLAVISIADCKVDADGWQVVQDDAFQKMMTDLETEFVRFLAQSNVEDNV